MKERVSLLCFLVMVASCTAQDDAVERPGRIAQAFASIDATLADFAFDGEVWTNDTTSPDDAIRAQLLYSVGQLNGDRSLARVPFVTLTNVVAARLAEGVRVTYRAQLPVAWGAARALPEHYTLVLPRVASDEALEAFVDEHARSCGGEGDRDSFWYYYRPRNRGCALGRDAVVLSVTVSRSHQNTTDKYPEYDRIWADNVLDVIAIFGRETDGARANGDPGIREFNRFVAAVKDELRPHGLTTSPPSVSDSPGSAVPAVELAGRLPGGQDVRVHARLVGYRIEQDGAEFDAWYDARSPRADLIVYSGHAGLGVNVGSLARRGTFVPGKYVMLVLNGCDTFAYVDETLAVRRAALNPDDVAGTRYMDVVQTAMPAYFSSFARDAMAVVRAALAVSDPPSYRRIFERFARAQVVLVTGEEDNTWRPGLPVLPP